VLRFGPASQLRQLLLGQPDHHTKPECQQGVFSSAWPERFVRQWAINSRISRTFFYRLCCLLSVSRQLGHDAITRLLTALLLWRLDKCNAILAGLPVSTWRQASPGCLLRGALRGAVSFQGWRTKGGGPEFLSFFRPKMAFSSTFWFSVSQSINHLFVKRKQPGQWHQTIHQVHRTPRQS